MYDDGTTVYDALLNQTDIGANKNKYYIIQMLETDASPPTWYAWNRWGRVGEERGMQNALRGPMAKEVRRDLASCLAYCPVTSAAAAGVEVWADCSPHPSSLPQ